MHGRRKAFGILYRSHAMKRAALGVAHGEVRPVRK
jgi:hypothetical protein